MAIFQPRDDNAFIAWLDANPNGYVINTERGGPWVPQGAGRPSVLSESRQDTEALGTPGPEQFRDSERKPEEARIRPLTSHRTRVGPI
jgi:hypothetical protein